MLWSILPAMVLSAVALRLSAFAAARGSPSRRTVHRTCASLKSRAMRTSRMVTPVPSKRCAMEG